MEALGVIRSPFETLADMPIQPGGAADIEGEVSVFDTLAKSSSGWLSAADGEVAEKRSDTRFS